MSFLLTQPIIPLQGETISIGGYHRTGLRPLGHEVTWETRTVNRRRREGGTREVTLLYQTLHHVPLTTMHYTSADGIAVRIEDVRPEDATIIDNTLNLVPPAHLRYFNRLKPSGILIHSTTGTGNSTSFTGGLNPGTDDASTLFFQENRGIVITYGALWHFREDEGLDICPTILHEIGHVLVHDGSLTDRYMEAGLRSSMRGTAVSRNDGEQEALCNAYMYMLCYGSQQTRTHNFGSGSGNQNSRLVREGLRQTRAFSTMLDENWRQRFTERPRGSR